jgi:5-methylcytosine-specific restriction protein A
LKTYKSSQVDRWRNGARWKRRTAHQLRIEPLCAMCKVQGVIEPACIVDHAEPHRGDQNRYWFGALQSLCVAHHNRSKQQIEVRGFSNEIGADGFPVDREHHPFFKEGKMRGRGM